MLKLLLLVLGCLPPGRLIEAVFLQECEGVIVNLTPNPNPECSEYVYCDGDNSFYCNGDCIEPVICYNTTTTMVTTRSPVSTTEASSIVYTEPQTVTTSEQRQPSTVGSTTSTTWTTSSSNPHVICRETGLNMVFPYPANKNYYYQCISRYLLLQQCPQNFYFNESQGKCTGTNPYRL
ncbi:hypothetical protein KR044_005627 [Drosophila immigrans]|nr:hypothetical protein KR044_005627 [Drosophila immigrans]